MELPERDRLALARRIVASIASEREVSGQIAKAVPGMEDIATGQIRGLTEAEFRDALE